MQLTNMPRPILSLATILLVQPVIAGLIPDLLQSLQDLQNIHKRCDNPCGYYGQLCCSSNEYCYTDTAGQAQCGENAVGAATTTVQATAGSWQYYTTTYVQTDLKTVTQTYSSFVGSASSSSCNYAQGQTPCGNACCNSGQYCMTSGSCAQVPGSSGYYSSLYTVTTVVTNTASAPLRPTTKTITTITSTGSVTTTAPFQTPVGTGGAVLTGASSTSSGGLSGGAIAGIVIGVIAGILFLLLLCACCCFKGLLDSLLAIFGLGDRRKRREETTIVEERHSHRSGGGRRTWFGTRPGKTEVVEERKSGWGRGASVAAFLGGLALILGLKRSKDRRDEKSSTGYGSEYSYYDSGTSSSSSSSGRRTRTNRSRSRSRASRGTRL